MRSARVKAALARFGDNAVLMPATGASVETTVKITERSEVAAVGESEALAQTITVTAPADAAALMRVGDSLTLRGAPHHVTGVVARNDLLVTLTVAPDATE